MSEPSSTTPSRTAQRNAANGTNGNAAPPSVTFTMTCTPWDDGKPRETSMRFLEDLAAEAKGSVDAWGVRTGPDSGPKYMFTGGYMYPRIGTLRARLPEGTPPPKRIEVTIKVLS